MKLRRYPSPTIRIRHAALVPHLASITNTISTTDTYPSFTYAAINVQPPFGTGAVAATLLQAVAIAGWSSPWGLQYAGTGELTLAVNPSGGQLSWQYRTYTYSARA